MQLRVQRETDLRAADMFKFMLVVLDASKLLDHFSQYIILVRTYALHVTGYKAVYREDVGHFDV